tara:strand:- start:1873 stop:2253 length:381 start_codon:yes stop_codon:yes gene_type:complete
MASNCSFRITRTTEDLAQTITALSQRLIKLEQRFEAMELQFNQNQSEMPVQEIEMLDCIDQQLKACKALLDTSSEHQESNQIDNENLETFSDDEQLDQMEISDISPDEKGSEEIWIEENKDETLAA